MPAVKLFDPMGSAFWVLWEYDPDEKMAFGMADLGFGFSELGSVNLQELVELETSVRIPIERDMAVDTRFEGYRSRNVEIPGYLQ